MKYDTEAIIKSKQKTKGAMGNDILSWVDESLIMCNIQPYNGERAKRDYGYTNIVHALMFSDPVDVSEGERILADSITYEIVYIERYKRHCELLLKRIDNYEL